MHLDKTVGILGDSLTLLGSVILAIDTLIRPTRLKHNQSITKTSQLLRQKGISHIRLDGSAVDPESLEVSDARSGRGLAIAGASAIVLGFGALLASRLLAP